MTQKHKCNAAPNCPNKHCLHRFPHTPYQARDAESGEGTDCTVESECVTYAARVRGVGRVGSRCRCEVVGGC